GTSGLVGNAAGRVRSLDGLRGVAALVVVMSHSMLLIPSVDAASLGSHRRDLAWWFTYTPLHATLASEEAVGVFFVLSGFVLPRAFDRALFSWRAYYPSRLVRLYLPVIGALAFAALTVAFLPRSALGNASVWLQGQRPIPITLNSLFHDGVLLRG